MNEKMKELLEKIGADLITNHGMTTGEILDENGKPTGIWYDEIEY